MGEYTISAGSGKARRSEKRKGADFAEIWVDEFQDKFGKNAIIDVFDHDAGKSISIDEVRKRAADERAASAAAHKSRNNSSGSSS